MAEENIIIKTQQSSVSKKNTGAVSLIAQTRYNSKKPPSLRQNIDLDTDHGTLGYARMPVEIHEGKSYFGCHH